MSVEADPNPGTVVGDTPNIAQKTEPLRAVHTPNFPDLLRGWALDWSSLPIRPARSCSSAKRATTSIRTSAASRLPWVWPFRVTGWRSARPCRSGSFTTSRPSLPSSNRAGHDACFMPRACHVTGNVQVHEMAWGGDDLWFVNTRFSCLCTLDRMYSFVPRWRPPFISAYEPSDRCHLNGLAMVDGRPRYVTALGDTDTAAGWRANKAHGGVLIDVPSGEVVTGGLSMPHSPRWHAGRLWVCESGAGTIGFVNPKTAQYEPIAAVPGFTRGLDIVGDLAFVGLSQVRESAVFSGIPITERLKESERTCGVCVVDLKTGQAIALLRFEDAVQEVFAVQVVPGKRYPELINDDQKLMENSFVLPDEALLDVPDSVRVKPIP